MILFLLFLFCCTKLANLQNPLPQTLQQMAALERPIIPNRLLDPSLDESLVHILLNPFEPTRRDDKKTQGTYEGNINDLPVEILRTLERSDLVDLCGSPTLFSGLPDFFPRFLCGFISIYQEVNITSLPYTRDLFAHRSSAIRFMNLEENYPCRRELDLTDVVAFGPNRIYTACMNESDPTGYSQFETALVLTHPFPNVSNCTDKVAICEMRSMIVQHQVVYQQRDCCCLSDHCVVLVFSQTDSLTPLILTTIDLADPSYFPEPTTSTLPPIILPTTPMLSLPSNVTSNSTMIPTTPTSLNSNITTFSNISTPTSP